MVKVYSSNLTAASFDFSRPLLPPAKSGGCPWSTSLRTVLNAILDMVMPGCQWRNLPSDFPAGQTVSTDCRNWHKGAPGKRTTNAYAAPRTATGRSERPSEVVLDRPTLSTVARVQQAVGFDCFKATKGRKRQTGVDT
ncbi:MAG TPA: transposase [Candidatus Sericytochromatia bacterium]